MFGIIIYFDFISIISIIYIYREREREEEELILLVLDSAKLFLQMLN